jgi:branched-chain amino acid transport system permease protein
VSLSLVLGQVLNGVVTGMLYALMGVGLSLILGILNLPNFAHGTLYALGAYLLFTVATWTGSFWVGLLIAPLGVAVLGAAIELLGMRRLYAAGHDFQLLLTFGLALILEQVLIVIWGPIGMSLLPPRVLGGAVDLGVTFYPRYRLFAMVVAGLLILAVWLGLERTRLGAIIRAGIEDKDMVSVLGIDVDRVFTLTFAVGAWLAGVAGALMVPIRGLTPTMGADILGIAFVVVALGGLGNLPGAMLAGIVIGLAQSLVALVWPVASIVVIFAVMAVVLLLRPQGLFGTR